MAKRMTGAIIITSWICVTMYLFLLVISVVTPSLLGAELSIYPIADSYTWMYNPDVNYGNSITIYSYNYTYDVFNTTYNDEKNIWLKFDLSEIPSEATVTSIILRMHTSVAYSDVTNKVGVFLCSNTTWQEMTITWNNCPQVEGQPIATVYVSSWDTNYDFNVTSAVQGKNVMTLVLKTLEPTASMDWVGFNSKESSRADVLPRLVVEYPTPSQPLTTDPSILLIIGLIVIVVVIGIIYGITRKGKQQSPSTTTPSTSPTI
ncbi:MAG: DNRLRE domain-containing protein [Candidatus Bathyarchaeota archaeon]